ncbi:DUF4158 domain-containing protein [Streptosporangium canum]
MTSIERTAYPQFKRLTSERVVHVFFTPTAEEVDWARERAAEPQALLAVVVALKCFQKMARFPSWRSPRSLSTTCGAVWVCLRIWGPDAPPNGTAVRSGPVRAWSTTRAGSG